MQLKFCYLSFLIFRFTYLHKSGSLCILYEHFYRNGFPKILHCALGSPELHVLPLAAKMLSAAKFHDDVFPVQDFL